MSLKNRKQHIKDSFRQKYYTPSGPIYKRNLTF